MELDQDNLEESNSLWIIGVAWSFTALASASVILKIVTTTRIVHSAGWDDLIILLSLILSIVASSLVHYAAVLGLGRHTAAVLADYGPERLALTAKMQILGYPFNIGAKTFSRQAAFSLPNIAIAILIVRLLDPNPRRKYCLMAMVTLQVVLAAIMAAIAFLQCSPVERLWNGGIEGSCWHPSVLNNYSYFVSAYTTLTDLVLAIVPISAFWNLQMNTSTKIGIMVLMGLTFLSAVVTVVKARYLHLFNDTEDPLWNVVQLCFWGLVEQNIVIFAACVPTLRPLVTCVFRPYRSGRASSGASTSGLGANTQSLGLRSLGGSSSRNFKQADGDFIAIKSDEIECPLRWVDVKKKCHQLKNKTDIPVPATAATASARELSLIRPRSPRHNKQNSQGTCLSDTTNHPDYYKGSEASVTYHGHPSRSPHSRPSTASSATADKRDTSTGAHLDEDNDDQASHSSQQGILKRVEVSMRWDNGNGNDDKYDGNGDSAAVLDPAMPAISPSHNRAGSSGMRKCDGRGTSLRAEMYKSAIVPESLMQSSPR